MSPDVVKRKITTMRTVLEDLEIFEGMSFEEFCEPQNHYAAERILQLLVEIGSDIVQHILKKMNEEYPLTYRTVFLRAGELGILSHDLAERLAQAAGMRNILVHLYETIDEHRVFKALKMLRSDFTQFLKEVKEQELEES